jgi:hypothetical protein
LVLFLQSKTKKKRMRKYLLMPLFLFVMLSCDDDEERASIVGSWTGDEAFVEVKYGLIPLYEDDRQDFDVTLTFNEDGTVVLKNNSDGTTTSGIYTLSGNELTTDVGFDLYDLSGPITFKVDRLTDKRLELSLDQKREVNVPDYGNITVEIIGHLHFDRS